MKSQISRLSHDPAKHYSGVYQQQGRMITDADWNELVDLIEQRIRAALGDVAGSGVPRNSPLRLNKTNEGLQIEAGTVYADGVRGEYAKNTKFLEQPDFPNCLAPDPDAHIYVDLWERAVTALEDANLRDPGLHGADTCTRTQTMVQVKWCPEKVRPGDENINPQIGNAELKAQLLDSGTGPSADPCLMQTDESARIGNYLFRLEVHDVKKVDNGIELTLKWSSENGAEQHALTWNDGSGTATPDYRKLPPDFKTGPWTFEVFNDISEKHLGQQLASGFVPARGQLLTSWDEPLELIGGAKAGYIRRWDGCAVLYLTKDQNSQRPAWNPTPNETNTVQDKGRTLDCKLESNANGGCQFTVSLSALTLILTLNSNILAGDYWLVVVRENAEHYAGLGIDDRVQVLNGGKPVGIRHHYFEIAKLANGEPQPYPLGSPMRAGFPALGDLAADRVPYDPTQYLDRWLDIVSSKECWAVRFGGIGDDWIRGFAARQDGDVAIAARLCGSAASMFLTLINPLGHVCWEGRYGTSSCQLVPQAVGFVENGDLVVAGNFTGALDFGNGISFPAIGVDQQIFIARFRADSGVIVPESIVVIGGEGNKSVSSLAIDRDWNIVIAGEFYGTLMCGKNQTLKKEREDSKCDIFVASIAGFKECRLWQLSGYGSKVVSALALDPEGNIFLAGSCDKDLSFKGKITCIPDDAGESRLFVVSYDADGGPRWATEIDVASAGFGGQIAVDADRNIIIPGYFQKAIGFSNDVSTRLTSDSGTDGFLVKLEGSTGRHVWSMQLHSNNAYGLSAVARQDDGVLVAGYFCGQVHFDGGVLTSEGELDAFVAVFDANGKHLRSARQGSKYASTRARYAALDKEERVVLAGHFSGIANFGGIRLASVDNATDVFVARLTLEATGPATVQEAIDDLVSQPIANSEPQDVVTGIITFEDLPPHEEMVSNGINPGLGAGPLCVQLALEVTDGVWTTICDPGYRPAEFAARVNAVDGSFLVWARRTDGDKATIRVRWWASRPRAPDAGENTVSIAVTVVPDTVNLKTGKIGWSQATVLGATKQTVAWTVSDSTLVKPQSGPTDNPWSYMALSTGEFTVKATSQADPSKTGKATITVEDSGVSIEVNPKGPVHLGAGDQRNFTATVKGPGTISTLVTWRVLGKGDVGSITPEGVYTAPNQDQYKDVTVEAISDEDPTKRTTVTVQWITK